MSFIWISEEHQSRQRLIILSAEKRYLSSLCWMSISLKLIVGPKLRSSEITRERLKLTILYWYKSRYYMQMLYADVILYRSFLNVVLLSQKWNFPIVRLIVVIKSSIYLSEHAVKLHYLNFRFPTFPFPTGNLFKCISVYMWRYEK